jgi:hypothetical protein
MAGHVTEGMTYFKSLVTFMTLNVSMLASSEGQVLLAIC